MNKEGNICKICKEEKEFLMLKNRTSTGDKFICRECHTRIVKKYRKTIKGQENTNKAIKKSTKKYEYKQKARILVARAVKFGRIKKSNICSICKKKRELHGHHDDYNKPLSVKWVCRICHIEIHKYEKKICTK